MAKAEGTKKRKRNRKARTEVSSSSSDSEASLPGKDSSAQQDDPQTEEEQPPVDKRSPPVTATKETPDEVFERHYLQQLTKEFANDLDKLRTANDFRSTASLTMLIDALKQGTACFSEEERRGVASASAVLQTD